MEITKETVRALVDEMKADGTQLEEIEELFKASLKAKSIDVDIYCAAMECIYEEE